MPRRSPRPPAGPYVPQAKHLRLNLRLEVPDTHPALRRWLTARFRDLAVRAGAGPGRVTLVIVGDAEMARLHRLYTGVPGTTDVLTFDLREAPRDPLDADLVICLDEAARQARQRGRAPRLEVLLYALHGLLHLLGYDDHTPADHARMHKREDELLTAAGLGPLYGF